MKNRLLKNFFSSGLQAVSIQIFGTIFFYIISLYLSKDDFGIISWGNATSSLIITILSCGLEQVMVRRVALSRTSDWAAVAYLIHAIVGVMVSLLILLIISLAGGNITFSLHLLPYFFIAQSLGYIANPFKQYLNAKERFTPYGVVAFISNAGRITVALLFIWNKTFNIYTTIYILIGSAVFELTALAIYTWLKTDLQLNFRFLAYKKLLMEARALYLAVLFDSSLSRFDWFLLGLMQANSVTADYTFAYRAFEVARLPIMIVGPIILPKFARLFNSNNDKLAAQKKRQVNKFFSLEIFFAIFMVLCLNIIWGPGIDLITKGKYGYSNSLIFFILSLCIPLQFTINLLWTLTFSAKRYKSVTIVTFITAVVNIVLDVALIHFYGGAGAAIAFLLSVCIQTAAYTFVVNKFIMRFSLLPLLVLAVAGSIAYAASVYLVPGIWSRIGIAVVVYVVLSLLSKQVGRQHLDILRLYLRR